MAGVRSSLRSMQSIDDVFVDVSETDIRAIRNEATELIDNFVRILYSSFIIFYTSTLKLLSLLSPEGWCPSPYFLSVFHFLIIFQQGTSDG